MDSAQAEAGSTRLYGRSIWSVIACGIALSLLSLPALALRPSEAEQAAIVLEDYFQRYCQGAAFETAKARLLSEASFRHHQDPYRPDPPEGEVWMINDTTLSRFGLSITARAGEGRCQFAVWPEATSLFAFVARRLEGSGAWQRNFVSRPDEGNLLERRQYSNDDLQRDDRYFVIELSAYRGDATVLGQYRRTRSESRALINDPDVRWHVTTVTEENFTIPVAEIWLQDHKLQLSSDTRNWRLSFHPRFYQHLNRASDQQRYYYRSQSGMNIDGRSVPSYQACIEGSAACAKDGAHFSMPLDQVSLNMLRSGQTLHISAETTAGEWYDFEFSLDGLADVMAEVESRFEPELLAAMAFAEGDKARFAELLEAGLNPHLKISQVPLLHAALSMDLPDWADLLIAHGADVNHRFEDGHGVVGTGLIMSAHYARDTTLMRHYLRLGANTEARDSNGRTALLRTVNYDDDLEKYRLLAAAGANLQARDQRGWTRLHWSARGFGDHTSELAWLIEQGLPIHAADDEGNTPLHVAIEDISLRSVRWLIEHGADPYRSNRAGQTAFDVARMVRDNPAEYHLPAAVSTERADEVRVWMSNLIEGMENWRIVVWDHPRYGNITEGSIQATMRSTGRSRDSIIRQLRNER